jgi:hypothetical protein
MQDLLSRFVDLPVCLFVYFLLLWRILVPRVQSTVFYPVPEPGSRVQGQTS